MLQTILYRCGSFLLKWGLILSAIWLVIAYVSTYFRSEPAPGAETVSFALPQPRPDVLPAAGPSAPAPSEPVTDTLASPSAPTTAPPRGEGDRRNTDPVLRARPEQIQLDVVAASVDGNNLRVVLRAVNQGTDRILRLTVTGPTTGPSKTQCIDQSGNTFVLADATIGSAGVRLPFVDSLLVAGVPTAIALSFGNVPLAGGQSQVHELALLHLEGHLFSPGEQRRGPGNQLSGLTAAFTRIPVPMKETGQ